MVWSYRLFVGPKSHDTVYETQKTNPKGKLFPSLHSCSRGAWWQVRYLDCQVRSGKGRGQVLRRFGVHRKLSWTRQSVSRLALSGLQDRHSILTAISLSPPLSFTDHGKMFAKVFVAATFLGVTSAFLNAGARSNARSMSMLNEDRSIALPFDKRPPGLDGTMVI